MFLISRPTTHWTLDRQCPGLFKRDKPVKNIESRDADGGRAEKPQAIVKARSGSLTPPILKRAQKRAAQRQDDETKRESKEEFLLVRAPSGRAHDAKLTTMSNDQNYNKYNQNYNHNKTQPNKPLAKFKAGAVVATVWTNSAQGAAGAVTYNSISLDRRYQDKNGQWQSTSSMRVNDLPKAALVLQKAYEHLIVKGPGENPARTETPAYIGATMPEEEALVA